MAQQGADDWADGEDADAQDWELGAEAGNLGRDWEVVTRILPPHWQAKAVELGAVRRQLRSFADVASVLRVLLIHLADGCSLRETAVRAQAAGLAEVSDVALLKRLVDGSSVSEPGATGSDWRLHYALNLRTLSCDEVHVTEATQGESLTRYAIEPGDIIMADRGYANQRGLRHVLQAGGDVVLRTGLTQIPLQDQDGKPLALLALMRQMSIAQAADWLAWVPAEKKAANQKKLSVRICAYRKTAAQTEAAVQAIEREARKKGTHVKPQTLEAAGYVIVLSTLMQPSAHAIMELYRRRWQVELAFKRLKSLLDLGHLKKTDPAGARAWLQGKLLVACLIETLILTAERFSPWGYPAGQDHGPAATLALA